MSTSEPLVWLPFDAARLDPAPAGLRYEKADPTRDDWQRPASIDEVELYVPPYNFARGAAELMAAMPRLRVVQTLTAGVEHIAPHVPEGVLLCNGRGIHDTSTAELVLALTLASLRGIPEFVREQDREEWHQRPLPALADKRVLIVGYGADRRGDRAPAAAVRGRGGQGGPARARGRARLRGAARPGAAARTSWSSSSPSPTRPAGWSTRASWPG